MKKLELVFTKSKHPFPIFSWLIRAWTWKPYSHIARRLRVPWAEKSSYFQASKGLVNYYYQDAFDREHEVVMEIELEVPDEMYSQIVHDCWVEKGNLYGTLQNVGIVIVDIARLFGWKIKNPWKKGFNCSELVYRTIILKMLGDQGYSPDTIKPHHIEDILVEKWPKDKIKIIRK